MEPKGSLTSSKDSSICLYPKPAKSTTQTRNLYLKIRFNIVLPFTPMCTKWSQYLDYQATIVLFNQRISLTLQQQQQEFL
jgi:hypothetical protein